MSYAVPSKSTTGRSLRWVDPRFWQGFTLRTLEQLSPELTARVAAPGLFRTTRRAVEPSERQLLEQAKRFTVPTRKRTVAAARWGNTGPLVVLVHGWNGHLAQLGAFVPPLLASGFQVVGFDAPGHGASSGSDSSIVEFADALEAITEVVRPFFRGVHGVIAHSLGGAAVAFALSRASARAGSSRSATIGLERARLVFVAPPIDIRDFARTFTTAVGLGEATRAALDGVVERRIGRPLDDVDALTIARGMRAPLLVMHDETDRAVPVTAGRRLVAAWPGATLSVTKGLGHARILRDPDAIATAVRFIAGAAERRFPAEATETTEASEVTEATEASEATETRGSAEARDVTFKTAV